MGFLQKAVAPHVYAPNSESEVNIGARLAPAVFVVGRQCCGDFPCRSVALEWKRVNARRAARETKAVGVRFISGDEPKRNRRIAYCLSVSAFSTACCLAISDCTPCLAKAIILASCWSSKTWCSAVA